MTELSKTNSGTNQAANSTQIAPLPSMTPMQMIEHLKAMGLGQVQRSKVMETYRDAGQAEALEQAHGYIAAAKTASAKTKAAVRSLLGITI